MSSASLRQANSCLFLIVTGTAVVLAFGLSVLVFFWLQSMRQPAYETLVVMNIDDSFIAARVKEFKLPQTLERYELVILAIERYHDDKGDYPPDLASLVPDYLAAEPSIYIRKGQELTYLPEPDHWVLGQDDLPPFTFHVYGHYPGLAFMHGWFLYYCPTAFVDCNHKGDRHQRWYRINDQWVWINSSAL